MECENNFGQWLKHRRRQLDLTQQQLADSAACSVVTIRKFEAGERRPSRELAELLAICLTIPAPEQESFVAFARGLRPSYEPVTETTKLTSPPIAQSPWKLAQNKPVSLPLLPTPFVGRNEELIQLANKLADPSCRLLTLVGPGGMGKTRLALAAAQAQAENFRDGVLFVPLATITDPTHIPQAIAHSLGTVLAGAEDQGIQLGRILQSKHLLLVLDNFEQIIDGAELLAQWLRQAPHVKLLITSRERLNLVEEWLLPVQGFAQIDPGVALFVQSARRVQADFSLAEQETAVSQICQYVGGMPLAIELAAGWTAALTCEQILTQMQQTFDFLSTRLRNVPQRHRSLRHLFDQTWQLLPPIEQTVLQKLSVFRGGFALAEAEAIAKASLPLLLSLINKSLVMADGHGRYDLHELTRHYAIGKLREGGEETAVRQLHLQTFVTLAETAEPQLHGPEAITWFKRLDYEQDNFRAALQWGVTGKAGDFLLRLVNSLWWFWFRRGYWQEAEKAIASAVEHTNDAETVLRCRALLNLSTVRAMQGRFGEAAPTLLQALAMARQLQDGEVLVAVLVVLGQATSDIHEAMTILEEARNIWEQNGHPHKSWVLAHLYTVMGNRMQDNGRYHEAALYYQQSLDLYRQAGNVDHIAYPLGSMGRLALHEGRLMEAYTLIGESVALSRAIGHQHGLSDWLIYLAKVMLYLDDFTTAQDYLQEAQRVHYETNNLRGLGHTLAYLALTALKQSHYSEALAYIQESFAIYQKVWQQSREADAILTSSVTRIIPDWVDCLFIAGLVAVAQAQYGQAAKLLVSAKQQQLHIGIELDPPLQQQIDQALITVQENVSPAAYHALSEAALDWSLDEMFRFMLSES